MYRRSSDSSYGGIIALILFIIIAISISRCSSNAKVTDWGETKIIDLPDNMKFINYNIQDSDSVWTTYRPMQNGDIAEFYIVRQSRTGLPAITGSGKFIVVESKDGVKAEVPQDIIDDKDVNNNEYSDEWEPINYDSENYYPEED